MRSQPSEPDSGIVNVRKNLRNVLHERAMVGKPESALPSILYICCVGYIETINGKRTHVFYVPVRVIKL